MNLFSEEVNSTIGVSNVSKEVTLDDGTSVQLDIWDTAGQEKYQCLLPMYARGAAGIICVFDLANAKSLEVVKEWINEHSEEYEGSIFFLVGNKTDLIRDDLLGDAENWACERSIDYMETSAKTNSNIESLFAAVATAVSTRSLFYGNAESTLVEEARPKRKCC